jgi:sulfonate transport system substrate-binding protein
MSSDSVGLQSMRLTSRIFRVPRILALLGAALLAGCGQSGEQELPVLRVADQLHVLQSALSAAGEDKPKNYRIQWSNFVGGPPVIAAQTGGSVDLGWMAETPLVFAQAAGSPVKVVAVSRGLRPRSSNIALVVAADSPFQSPADLKGKKVGFMPGTVTQYLVARVLDNAGLSLDDITPVRISSFSTATLHNGTVDAFTTAEPMLSKGLADGSIRVLAYGGEPHTPGFNYLVASDAALGDAQRTALIGDFVARTARAIRWQRENVSQAAPVTAKAFNVSPELAEQILKRTPLHYTPIDSSIVDAHQQEADLFHKLGLIRTRVDAAKLFDNRFDKQVAEVEHTP